MDRNSEPIGSHKHEPFIPSPFADWLVLAALVAGIFTIAKLVQVALS